MLWISKKCANKEVMNTNTDQPLLMKLYLLPTVQRLSCGAPLLERIYRL